MSAQICQNLAYRSCIEAWADVVGAVVKAENSENQFCEAVEVEVQETLVVLVRDTYCQDSKNFALSGWARVEVSPEDFVCGSVKHYT